MNAVLKARKPRRYSPAAAGAQLTEREAQVMHLLGRGCSNKQIAGELGISQRTAEIHRGRLLEKIGVRGWVQFGIWYADHFPVQAGLRKLDIHGDVAASLHSVRRARELIAAGSIELARGILGGVESLLSPHVDEKQGGGQVP